MHSIINNPASPAALAALGAYKELFLNTSWNSSANHVLNAENIVRWNQFAPTVSSLETLRWTLHQNIEHAKKILDAIDANSDAHAPTHHFRAWLEGAFYADCESEVEIQRVFKETQEYRDHFGMSVGHACGGCHRNEPCDICGKAFPLKHYTGEIDERGHHVTISAKGKRASNTWQTRCSNQLTCEIGLHVCGACGSEFTYFRKQSVARAVVRRHNAHKSPAKLRRYQKRPTAFAPFECVGGRFKGQRLQLIVEQNGAPASSRDALLDEDEHPLGIKLVHHSSSGPDVLEFYELGRGRKSSNGCSKTHRAQLAQDREIMADLNAAWKELMEEEEEAKRAMERKEMEREYKKGEYMRTRMASCGLQGEEEREAFARVLRRRLFRCETLEEFKTKDWAMEDMFDRLEAAEKKERVRERARKRRKKHR